MGESRGAALLAGLIAVAALGAAAHAAAGEADGSLENEILSPKERAALEEQRRREAEPVLVCEPAWLEETVEQGEEKEVTLTVRNAGGQTLRWSVQPADLTSLGWLKLSRRSGRLGYNETNEVVVTFDASGLEPGLSEEEFALRAPGVKGSPFPVAVRLRVLPARGPVDGPGHREARRRVVGVRAGLLVPGSGSREDYAAGTMLGFLWKPDRGGERLGYEFELRLGLVESESGVESSTTVAGHARARWRLWGGQSKSLYAVGGLSLVSETVGDDELGSTSSFGSALDLGAGATFAERYDARLAYSILLGSDNVGGVLAASLGVMF